MFRAVRGLLVLLLLLILAASGVWLWTRSSLPKREGRVVLAGLAREVKVERAPDGLPHISASSVEDAFFALGFVHAQDRLWQMEYARLEAHGRLAEVLGERAIPWDRLARTLGLAHAAAEDLELLGPRARGLLDAYRDGINSYLARHAGALPPEFRLLGHRPEEWQAADSLAIGKLLAWDVSVGLLEELFMARIIAASSPADGRRLWRLLDGVGNATEWAALYRELPLDELAAVLQERPPRLSGGRSWVVAGERTASGSPLLAAQVDGAAQAPALFHLARMSAPGLELAAAAVPGYPALLQGRNETIAWSLQPGGFDTQDLYLERLGDGAPRLDRRTEAEVREERIAVRGGEDIDIEVRRVEGRPLLSDLVEGKAGSRAGEDGQTVVSLAWSGLAPGDRTIQGAFELAFAGDWGSFRDAAANLHGMAGWVLYADSGGVIGVQATGRLPRRSATPRLPVPAWLDGAGWDGFERFARLPSLRDPRSGVIVFAGDRPSAPGDEGTPGGAAEADLARLLTRLGHHTEVTFGRLLTGPGTPPHSSLLKVARQAKPTGSQSRLAHAELLASEEDRALELVFTRWSASFARLLLEGLGQALMADAGERPEFVASLLGVEGSRCFSRSQLELTDRCRDAANLALQEAAAQLSGSLGEDPERWREAADRDVGYRHAVFDRTFLAPLFRVGGEMPSIADTWSVQEMSRPAPVYRAVYDLSQPLLTNYLSPGGPSGNPLSPWYRSFQESWRAGDLRRTADGADDATAGYQLLLLPRR